MNRDVLLDRLKRLNLNKYKYDKLLEEDDTVLEMLLDLNFNLFNNGIDIINAYNDKASICEALAIYKNAKYNYVYRCLVNNNAIQYGISLEGSRIINMAKEEFNAVCACDVLCNENAIIGGVALEGAKIINSSRKWYNAYYARYVLMSNYAIKMGIALEGAKLINESNAEFNALFASEILCNETLIRMGKAISTAKLINQAKNWDTASKILDIYMDVIDDSDLDEKINEEEKSSICLLSHKVIRRKSRKVN